jgi:MBOAT, membrane-bound O-acyltransferase family
LVLAEEGIAAGVSQLGQPGVFNPVDVGSSERHLFRAADLGQFPRRPAGKSSPLGPDRGGDPGRRAERISRPQALQFSAALLPIGLWEPPIELIGLSYMLFKFIHVLVDQWQGQLADCTLLCYANYQLAFFTLLAGPIQRYNDFHAAWNAPVLDSPNPREILSAWSRLLIGLCKMGAISPLMMALLEQANDQQSQALLEQLLVNLYAYPVYLYFNFSGYTDVVIGSARLLGFPLPENFNHPYLV